MRISAKLWESGITKLINKFTAEGDGHVIYDAVSDDSWGVMVGFNLKRNRSNDALERHFKYYQDHYYSIFSDSDWDYFLKNDVNISGINSLKKSVCDFVIEKTEEYIRYATMRMFLGG